MTKTIANQAASFALAVIATFGIVSGVSSAAAHQRTVVESKAMLVAMNQAIPVQHVTVIGHRHHQA